VSALSYNKIFTFFKTQLNRALIATARLKKQFALQSFKAYKNIALHPLRSSCLRSVHYEVEHTCYRCRRVATISRSRTDSIWRDRRTRVSRRTLKAWIDFNKFNVLVMKGWVFLSTNKPCARTYGEVKTQITIYLFIYLFIYLLWKSCSKHKNKNVNQK